MDILKFKKANCKNCFKCLRECSVKAIAYKDGQAEILRENCLICGHCLTVCPQNAKQVRNDVYLVKEMIASGKKVVASVAPSFIAAFPADSFGAFESALKKLGFYAVRETSAGAAAVAKEYERLLRERKAPVLISTACPTVVKLAEKYHPDALPYLAGVVSPMTAHARMLRQAFGESCYVVFIGPCISKKDEAEWEDGGADCAITFDELQEWLAEKKIPMADKPQDAGEIPAGARREWPEKARLFPVSGGILKTMAERLDGVRYASVSGLDKCREVLKEAAAGNLTGFFVEMSACEGSCLNGPCMLRPAGGVLAAEKTVSEFASRPVSHSGDGAEIRYTGDLTRKFTARPVFNPMPGEKAIRDILLKTGKKSEADELNCGACGYATCREKAIAVFQGKAEITMCMPYMRERAEFLSDKVIAFTPNAILVLDSFLNIQAVNQAACEMFSISDIKSVAGRYIGELTDASVFEEAFMRKENIIGRETFLYRSDKYVEQSVIYVREHDFIFGIFKDLTEAKKQTEKLEKVKMETVDTADRVIDKQMRIVQEIAMLLGESTAETKIALTKLKETMLSKEG